MKPHETQRAGISPFKDQMTIGVSQKCMEGEGVFGKHWFVGDEEVATES